MDPDINDIAHRIAMSRQLVVDAETTGLDWRKDEAVGYVLTFSPDPADSVYLPIRHKGGGNLDERQVIQMLRYSINRHSNLRTVGFNLGFDLKFMQKDGIVPVGPLEDAQINAFLVDERQPSFSLDGCCRWAGVQEKKGDELYKHLAARFGGEPGRKQMANYHLLAGDDPIGVDYAVGDGTSTWQLLDSQQTPLDTEIDGRNLRDIWALECRIIRVLHRMSYRGIKVDEQRLRQVRAIVEQAMMKAASKLPNNLNVMAPSELKRLFTDAGYTDWPTTEKGNASFAEEWLVTNPIGQSIVAVRKMRTMLNSFLDPMIERHLWKGRVHTTYNQTRGEEFGTITGRLSSSDPNLQQVHKRDVLMGSIFRSIFIPDEGMVMSSSDYNQCEPRLLAHYANVRLLINGYLNDPPIDAHTVVATAARIPRQAGKTLNQALLTGAGITKATMMLKRPADEANKIVANYFESMPEIRPFQKHASAVYVTKGFIRSLLGRRARLDDPRFAYKALNRLLQCGNADVIKKAMADMDEYYASEGDRVHLLNSVHDDLVDQFHPEDYLIHERGLELMQDFGPDGQSVYVVVPLPVDSGEGKNWAEATYGQDVVSKSFAEMGATYD